MNQDRAQFAGNGMSFTGLVIKVAANATNDDASACGDHFYFVEKRL
jgi:hypothetical protein